jgi:hypothetical protein
MYYALGFTDDPDVIDHYEINRQHPLAYRSEDDLEVINEAKLMLDETTAVKATDGVKAGREPAVTDSHSESESESEHESGDESDTSSAPRQARRKRKKAKRKPTIVDKVWFN